MKKKTTILQASLLLVYFICLIWFEWYLRQTDDGYRKLLFNWLLSAGEALPLTLILSLNHLSALFKKGRIRLNPPFLILTILLIFGLIPNSTLNTILALNGSLRLIFFILFWFGLLHCFAKISPENATKPHDLP